jgi:hypothetical protein
LAKKFINFGHKGSKFNCKSGARYVISSQHYISKPKGSFSKGDISGIRHIDEDYSFAHSNGGTPKRLIIQK